MLLILAVLLAALIGLALIVDADHRLGRRPFGLYAALCFACGAGLNAANSTGFFAGAQPSAVANFATAVGLEPVWAFLRVLLVFVVVLRLRRLRWPVAWAIPIAATPVLVLLRPFSVVLTVASELVALVIATRAFLSSGDLRERREERGFPILFRAARFPQRTCTVGILAALALWVVGNAALLSLEVAFSDPMGVAYRRGSPEPPTVQQCGSTRARLEFGSPYLLLAAGSEEAAVTPENGDFWSDLICTPDGERLFAMMNFGTPPLRIGGPVVEILLADDGQPLSTTRQQTVIDDTDFQVLVDEPSIHRLVGVSESGDELLIDVAHTTARLGRLRLRGMKSFAWDLHSGDIAAVDD